MSATTAAAPSPARNLAAGTASKYLVLGVNIALGVFLLPFTVRHLGTADYGLWMLVASMTYYFQLLDLGYGSGVVRHVAEADARGDIPRVNQILSTFVAVYGAIGLAAAAGAAAIVVWVIPRFPNLTPEQIGRAQAVLALIAVRIAIGFPMTVFGAATTARQRFALNNLVALAVALANGLVTYFVLSLGYGLVPLVAATTAVALASYAAYAWTARRALPELRIRRSFFNRALVREVTAFSMYLFVIDIAVQIGFNLDNVVIGAVMGTSAVAVYAVALRLADYQRQMCSQFNSLLFPVVVRYSAEGDAAALRTTLVEATRIALTLVVGVTVCVIGFGDSLILRWMGPGFEMTVPPLYVLAVTGIVLVGQGPLGNVLLATGRHRLVAFVSLAEALANLVLSLLLVRRYGILGVAIGTAVPVFAANLFILLPAACRQAGLTVRSFGRSVAVAPLIGAVPASAAVLVLRTLLPAPSLLSIVGQGVVVAAVYFLAVVAFGLDGAVRRQYFDFARQLRLSSFVRIRMPRMPSLGARA
jgi:O-antigen/teichoic acid export membrane protein